MALSPEEENVREKNVYLAKLAEQAERSAGAAALRRRRLSLCLHRTCSRNARFVLGGIAPKSMKSHGFS